jgi:hypothetical protein
MRVREYQDWTIEEKMYMPDMNGRTGIDLFRNAGYEWVKWTDDTDLAVSKNGVSCGKITNDKALLMIFEPPNQLPYIYNTHYFKRFRQVMSTVKMEGIPHFYIPRAFNNVDVFFNRPKTDLLCMVGRNMDVNGLPKTDLTRMRLQLIDYFTEKLGPKEFHLYGRWPAGPCYKGEISPIAHGLAGYNLNCPVTKAQKPCWDAKWSVFSSHKFALALENSIWPGYYGCKMIEAMQCGCIPLYVGDPDIDSHTPKDVYIDMRGRSMDELLEIITSMSEETRLGYQERIMNYLKTKGNDLFSSVTFAKKVVAGLDALCK